MPEAYHRLQAVALAILASLLVYCVPVFAAYPFMPYPFGVIVALLLESEGPPVIAGWIAWHLVILYCLSRGFLQGRRHYMSLGIGIGLGGVAIIQGLILHDLFKDHQQEMVETRLPEAGNWAQRCEVEGYRLARVPPAPERLEQGLVWVEQTRPRKLKQLNAVTCVVEDADRPAFERRQRQWSQAIYGTAIRCTSHPVAQEGFVCDHYYGSTDVIEWDFNGLRGKHEVRSSGGPASATVNRAGTLIAVATGGYVGHHTQAFDSIYVLRVSDGEVVFCRHLDPFREMIESPVLHFVGDRYLTYSFDGTVRVFAIPEGAARHPNL